MLCDKINNTCTIEAVIIDWGTGELEYRCSECKFPADPQDWAEVYNYCPNCGRKVMKNITYKNQELTHKEFAKYVMLSPSCQEEDLIEGAY